MIRVEIQIDSFVFRIHCLHIALKKFRMHVQCKPGNINTLIYLRIILVKRTEEIIIIVKSPCGLWMRWGWYAHRQLCR